ncbi:MAG: TIGR01777 family protein [Ignavibacteriaceae bacterium]|nr:TIGR01777 family oxidoreductase [Ignavibacterium sp.]MCC6254705.1 TIGR01777 family protein [Ignavibacteriaceae bacterium]
MKRIIVTGATGLIGQKLVSALIERGDEVIIFSRDITKAKTIIPNANEYVEWDYIKPELWKTKLDNSDAVVHLAGTNLFAKRWNDSFKNEVLKSRQISTKNLVDAIKSCSNKPQVFISASGVGYYGDCGDTILDETSSSGNDFLAEVCKVWEGESKRVEDAGVRSVQIRTGLVLSTEDGALKQMLPPFKFYIGGPLGNGKQWASWLHIEDIIGIYLHAIENTELRGAVNAASPNPVRMNEFTNTLGNVLHRPSLFPVPKFILRLVIGEAAEVVTASQRVDVQKLLNSDYKFKFDFIKEALKDLL